MGVTTARSHVPMSLLAWICTRLLAGSDLLVLGVEVTDAYTCTKVCSTTSSQVFPLILRTRSRLECATACSKREWCHRYVSTIGLPDSKSSLYECTILADDGLPCQPTPPAAPDSVMCVRQNHGENNNSKECGLTTLTVLEVKNDKASTLVDYVHLQNLVAAGNELKVQFDVGTSRYVSRAVFTDLSNWPSETCAEVLDVSMGLNSSDSHLLLRKFCVDSSPNSRTCNVAVTPPFATPSIFSWIVQRGQQSYMGTNRVVFTTSGTSSLLEAAVDSGYEIKLLSSGSNAGVMWADVISQNKGKSNEIAAQTTLYERGQYKIVSHFTKHPTKIVLLDLSLGKESSAKSEATEVNWLADPCWKPVHSSNTSGRQQRASVHELRTAVNSGQRLRVRFVMDDLVILASPDFVGVDGSQTVVAHVARALSQKSVLGELVKNIGVGDSNQTMWTNYYVTSNGSISSIDASKVTPLFDKAATYWYTETRNYSLAHSSSPKNATSLARLAALVLAGQTIRVKVTNGTTKSFYSCHVISIINNGAEVRCQTNGQLLVNFLGAAPGAGQVSLSSLASSVGAIVGTPPPADCFQTVVLLAWQGSVEYTLCCQGSSNSSQVRSSQPKNVEWLVAE